MANITKMLLLILCYA